MKITSYRCPECNAPIQTKDLSDIVRCEHCGAQPFIDWSDNDEENELGEDYTPINNNYNYEDSIQSSFVKESRALFNHIAASCFPFFGITHIQHLSLISLIMTFYLVYIAQI